MIATVAVMQRPPLKLVARSARCVTSKKSRQAQLGNSGAKKLPQSRAAVRIRPPIGLMGPVLLLCQVYSASCPAWNCRQTRHRVQRVNLLCLPLQLLRTAQLHLRKHQFNELRNKLNGRMHKHLLQRQSQVALNH